MAVLAGQRITAGMFTGTKSATQDASSTFSSTSYTESPGSNAFPSTTFVAPTSGEVIVSHSAWLENDSTGRTYLSWIIRNGGVVGSGTTFLDGGDERSLVNGLSSPDDRDGVSYHVTGLTAGNTYNIRLKGKVTANNGQAFWQHLIVKPCQ